MSVSQIQLYRINLLNTRLKRLKRVTLGGNTVPLILTGLYRSLNFGYSQKYNKANIHHRTHRYQ